jgi:catechol 2,3-dioxygenase-like lactoylglutathione lyase family enzyme
MHVREILETCLYVDDLAAAERFYRDVLGLVFVERQPDRHVFFRCGNRMLLLFEPAASSVGGMLPPHGAQGAGHVAFAVNLDELAAWKTKLVAAKIAIEAEIDWSGRGQSLYFRDPAGNSLELATPGIWGLELDV